MKCRLKKNNKKIKLIIHLRFISKLPPIILIGKIQMQIKSSMDHVLNYCEDKILCRLAGNTHHHQHINKTVSAPISEHPQQQDFAQIFPMNVK